VVLFRRYRARLLMRDRRIGLVLIVWALFSIAQGVLTPFIDNGAHVGGLVAGALLARGLHPVVLDPPSDEDRARMRHKGWVSIAIVVAAALGWLLR
jgi:rhomboid protease GluP